MNKTMSFATFVLGAAIGSAVTWYYAKKKYEQIAQEEIDSVKEVFKPKKTEPDKSVQEKAEMAREKPSVAEYAKKLSQEGYTNYSNYEAPEDQSVEEEEENEDEQPPVPQTYSDHSIKHGPYVITPDEFGEFDDYDKISLTYYADHILTDDNDEIMEDVEGAIGFESLNHFGEYDDDSVFVRNDRLKTDYEILRDERDYSDVIKSKPYLKENE